MLPLREGTKKACNKYKIVRKATGGKRQKSSFLFLQINGQEERFEVTRNLWNNVNQDGNVLLCTQKGHLGYDFVKEFKIVNK